jgi:Ni,Fe-hydrogenase III small subunit
VTQSKKRSDIVQDLVARLAATGETLLGRSLAIRHVDAGSCGGCEMELLSVTLMWDHLGRHGICMVDDPRWADILLITGVSSTGLAESARQCLAAMARPRFVVAVGDCAVDGGIFKSSSSVLGGAGAILPVDLVISGCPPSPARIISGLLAVLDANRVPSAPGSPAGRL